MFNKSKVEDHFMLYIPVKNPNNWTHKDNVVYLVFKHDKPIERLVAWLTGKPTARDLRFDKLAIKAWQLIDGSNNVFKIGQVLQKEFGKDCEPVYDKLIAYLRYLNRRGWIKFKRSNSFSNSKANL